MIFFIICNFDFIYLIIATSQIKSSVWFPFSIFKKNEEIFFLKATTKNNISKEKLHHNLSYQPTKWADLLTTPYNPKFA